MADLISEKSSGNATKDHSRQIELRFKPDVEKMWIYPSSIHRAAFSLSRYSDRKEAAPASLKLVVVQKALRVCVELFWSLISTSIELDSKTIYMGERAVLSRGAHVQNLCPNCRLYTFVFVDGLLLADLLNYIFLLLTNSFGSTVLWNREGPTQACIKLWEKQVRGN